MCRIAVIKGNLSRNKPIQDIINEEQKYGGTIKQEKYSFNDVSIFLNRFDVTTSKFKTGTFPLITKNYVLAFNGEVYSFREECFNTSNALSDAHFAAELIEKFGHQTFFKEADFEGTFVIYDKKCKETFVYADQLNTKGCFYTVTTGNIIIAQELAIIKTLLDHCKVKRKTAIQILKRGHVIRITHQNQVFIDEYKPDFKYIWNASSHGNIGLLKKAIIKAVLDRIPVDGPFGVLCGGGVDSSLVLKIIVDYLKKTKTLERLKIFTLGTPTNKLSGDENDLENVYDLLNDLNISRTNLEVIYPIPEWDSYLIKSQILCKYPHLLAPNPVQTQVRHISTMSGVLATIVLRNPQINVVISGDFADEVFGGYNSMHNGDLNDLAANIQHKLDDLQLNDASRVTLASLRGCKYLVEQLVENKIKTVFSAKNVTSQHPIEVRTPFASPLIARALQNFSKADLVARRKGIIHVKYALRLVAEKAGVPEQFSWRKKVPFNEGGTGIRNTEPYEPEEKAGLEYVRDNDESILALDHTFLELFNIAPYKLGSGSPVYEYALYCASMQSGLGPLILGKTFRHIMPDSNYATKGNLNLVYQNLIQDE